MSLIKERITAGHWQPPWLRYQHESRYRWAAELVAGRAVLDVACANAYGSAVLAARGASLVISADVALDPLLEASTFGRPFLTCASATRLPFADRTFDLVVSLETVEHIDDDETYAKEMGRVLKRDGLLICSTPNRRVLNPGRTLSDHPFNPFHIREYSANELETLLRGHFGRVILYGQSAYRNEYVATLERIGRRFPMAAVRLHQMRKLLGIAFERPGRHYPRPLPFVQAEPEVLIAMANAPIAR
ncbi:MAG TPA: class I SAM-dependent methyltransferase [Thermoanaerobaculia bacterium]|jgi:SAM-dependent methyltransferase|nr:class I SAM-dependent methyltransferase [Thermoanaerobaculia bacterium]